jgi:hypothetical protein
MRAALAESLLGLLTHAAHAATIVGDLIESHGRARTRFWLDVGSIGLALFTSAVRHAPLRTLWLAVVGLIAWGSIYVSTRAVAAGLGVLAVRSLSECCTAPVSSLLWLAAALIISNWGAGFWLGFRIRAAGFNPCMPLAAVWLALTVAVPFFPPLRLPDLAAAWYCLLVSLFAVPLLYLAPLLHGGALGARCRA